MTRFRWVTQCRALDVLEVFRTNAEFHRIFEEFGLGEELDAEGGVGLTTPKLHSLLLRLLRRNPGKLDTEGNLVSESLVREAARYVPDVPEDLGYPWESRRIFEKPEATALRNSLAVDGWTVANKVLVPTAPVALAEPRSRLHQNLDALNFADAVSRLEQMETALDGGNWEASNGIARGFLAALFVAICQEMEQGAPPREESEARKHLAEIGFFGSTRQTGKFSPEADFVWKMCGMLGTEGIHAGETTPDTAVFRYALVLLTADHFLKKLRSLP